VKESVRREKGPIYDKIGCGPRALVLHDEAYIDENVEGSAQAQMDNFRGTRWPGLVYERRSRGLPELSIRV